MKTVHLLFTCDIGGIEILCKDYARFSQNENQFVIFSGKGKIAEEIRNIGAEVTELEADKIGSLKALKKAVKICTGDDVACIVTHHESPLNHLAMMYAKWKTPRVKTIAYAHSAAENLLIHRGSPKAKICNGILKSSFLFSDGIIAISEFVKKTVIRDFNVKAEKVFVVYNGTEIDYDTNVEPEKRDKTKFIYVGRLIQEKGVQNTLSALAKLKDCYQFHFTVVGDGSYRGELERLTESLKLTKQVEFLGNRRDVKELLSQAGIFLHMPECEEGFGITVIEALASGIVCICAKKGALPEILGNSEFGYLVKSEQELITLLEWLLSDTNDAEKEYSTKSALAKERAKKFSVEIFARELDHITRNM